MSELIKLAEQIGEYAFVFFLGYLIAYLAKNFGNLWQRWGALLGFFLLPAIIAGVLGAAAGIADYGDAVLSSIFGAGYFIRLFKRDD